MAETWFPSGAGWTPGASFSDNATLNIGTVFALTASTSITGVRFYSPQSQTVTAQLWASGTKVKETTGVSVSAGWNRIMFATAQAGTTGVDYIASVLGGETGTVYYSRATLKFTDGTDAVPVTVGLGTSNTWQNGLYTYGTSIPSTTTGATGPWFGIDAILDDGSAPDTGYAVAAVGSGVALPPAVSGTMMVVRAQGSGSAPVPAVSGSGAGTVAAVRAQGTGLAEAPAVDVIQSVSGGGPASGTGQAIPPAVSNGTVNGIVTAVRAIGTGTARAPGVNVVETLPANVSTGRLKGRFGTAEVLVGDNDGIANVYPITTETITFTSTASVLLNSGASPDPIVILPKPIVCTLDSQGYMVDSAGHRWCDLIATDDNDLTPSGRKWTVTCSAGLGISPFAINVAGGTTVDLTTLIPT